jgi:Flp pilus assembly protein TadG
VISADVTMAKSGRSRQSFRNALRCFGRRSDGAAAIEFAVAGPLFMLLVFFLIENGLVLFIQAALDNATRDAARLIRTGQVQIAGGAASLFTAQLCADLSNVIPCTSLQVNVQSATSFSQLSAAASVNAGGNLNNPQFSPGTPGQVVIVQVAYNLTAFMPWFASFITGRTTALLMSTATFQNEPYQ